MNDVLARAARDFEDDTLRRQHIAKNIENEIAIAQCRRRMLAMIGHLPRVFDWLELCLRHTPQSASRRVRMCSLRRFLVIRFEAVYDVATVMSLLRHCRNPASAVTRRERVLAIVHGSAL
jgi:hypothetical protein